jgi:hypothetical protein
VLRAGLLGLCAALALVRPSLAEEQRCRELANICLASEPMNTDDYQLGVCKDPEDIDFADSTTIEATRAWTRCASSTPVLAASVGLPMVGAPISYVMQVSGGIGTFSLTGGWTSATRRLCARAYRRFSSNYAGFGTCEANKQQEFVFGGGAAIQHSESGLDQFILWAGGMSDPPPGNELDTSGPHLVIADCASNWCRQEICISGNVAAGTGISLEGRVDQVGVANPKQMSWVKTPVGDGPGPLTDVWAALAYRQRCGAPQGYAYLSHVMVAAWDADQGQYIGRAIEIEGPDGPPPTPTPPAPPPAPIVLGNTTTLPGDPSVPFEAEALSLQVLSATSVRLNWSHPGGAEDFDLIIDGVDTNQQYRTIDGSVRSAVISGLAAGQQHCFAVQARYPPTDRYPISAPLCSGP